MNIKQLIQDEADTKAAITKAKKEGRTLNALKERTPEQTARLDAVFAELDALDEKLEATQAALSKARRLQDDERASTSFTTLETGDDRKAAQAWGPTLHSDATPAMRA